MSELLQVIDSRVSRGCRDAQALYVRWFSVYLYSTEYFSGLHLSLEDLHWLVRCKCIVVVLLYRLGANGFK